MFLLTVDGDVGELLQLPQGCQGPFRGSGGKVISLEMTQRKSISARVEGTISMFYSSCSGIPLELRLRPQGPACGASGKSSLHASREGPLRIPLHSLPGPRSSSGVEAGNSGFLSRADRDLSVPLGRPEGSQALSLLEPCMSALLSSQKTVSGFLSG